MHIGGVLVMRYTKRSRKENIRRVLKWYMRDRGVSELEVMIGMPEMYEIVDGGGEMDADDMIRAFDYLDIDLVCVPRGDSKALNWFCLSELPYDDGGKNKLVTLRGQRQKRKGKGNNGIKGI